ncbi:LAMI_0A02806g1_1 [Lachancea mirantina]|uniref:LAMI_0A02806g1_1 n=1 Tax=Lachancea mirantina TaxID=1230905 RepID=A0A1G4INA9_9SACH|nr:LAMI_0A02806g1_1 [Lachancea mirantina]
MTTDIATGRIGNLSKEQELKIKQVWAHMLTHWGVPVDTKNVFQSRSNRGGESKSDADSNKNSKKGGKLFGKFLKGSGGSSKSGTSDQRDRSGSLGAKQTTEELETLFSGLEPSEVRENFWDMLRTDYPDNLLLRFLRARKWDTHKAMSMIAHTLRWRLKEAKPDEVIMGGELAAYKKNEKGYIKNIELSKATIRGFDNKGRPIVYVRPRLHHSSDQTEDEMKEYCLLIIEQTRLFLKEPVDCATILFDLTDFSMANMDYSPVQYLISCFEAHYPECLGHLFIHKAPWIFPPIWNIIKNWLDPVVASKIVFTKNTSDLVKYIPEKHIPASLGGDDKYDFDSFKKPDESVDAKLQDHETRNAIQEKRSAIIKSYIDTTVAWIESTAEKESSELLQRKIELSKQLSDNFRKLDPYIRSRSVYDINGTLEL